MGPARCDMLTAHVCIGETVCLCMLVCALTHAHTHTQVRSCPLLLPPRRREPVRAHLLSLPCPTFCTLHPFTPISVPLYTASEFLQKVSNTERGLPCSFACKCPLCAHVYQTDRHTDTQTETYRRADRQTELFLPSLRNEESAPRDAQPACHLRSSPVSCVY